MECGIVSLRHSPEFDKFYETYDIRIFAPNHTNVIHKDLPRNLGSLRKTVRIAITGDFHLVY